MEPSSLELPLTPFEIFSGFEGTQIVGSGTDVLETTEHTIRFRADFRLMKKVGMCSLRACIRWHEIENKEGKYDWEKTDAYMASILAYGLDPIVDPLHHTSWPEWLKGGFSNPKFVDAYFRFVKAFAERYPWVTRYTVINEPWVTTYFCGGNGFWHPHYEGDSNFVPMIRNVCKAIVRVSKMLIKMNPNVCLVHVDASERHSAIDEVSKGHAQDSNERRFLVPDLILGKVSKDHYLYRYLQENGFNESDFQWFRRNRTRIDVLGLDYYSHSELAWGESGLAHSNPNVVGFCSVALEYALRYPEIKSIMLTETNIRGCVTDRISWLRYMMFECEKLVGLLPAMGQRFIGFCWYPFVDSTDWDSLVREANGHIDPQGIFWIDESRARHASEFSELVSQLARGEITGRDLPAYRFDHEHVLIGRKVKDYLKFMEDWPWVNT